MERPLAEQVKEFLSNTSYQEEIAKKTDEKPEGRIAKKDKKPDVKTGA
jgi:hypothetical protein